ncbi:MAG TPA: ribonuclease P protein component [Anaeromyxobacteraceae bacterium]|nr:ribonuclease P protein component [Anaeromyxobacteraceae bacterium]
MKFGKAAHLRRRREYLAAQNRGRRLFARELVVLAIPNGCGRARLGITVSSKVANAVVRNQIKRWVREAFRVMAAQWPAVDLVVIARTGAVSVGLDGAREALEAARRKLAANGGGAP